MDQPNESAEKKVSHAAETRSILITKLLQAADFFEVYHETVFRCFRKGKNGQNQEVIITLYDAGKGVDPDLRYTCVARAPHGVAATGEPSQYADTAIDNVNWNDLDK